MIATTFIQPVDMVKVCLFTLAIAALCFKTSILPRGKDMGIQEERERGVGLPRSLPLELHFDLRTLHLQPTDCGVGRTCCLISFV